MLQIPNCLNCGDPIPARVGRGLCRTCWDKPEIRLKYPPVASFGGREASRLGNDAAKRKREDDGPPKAPAPPIVVDGEVCSPLPPGPERTYAEIQTLRRRSHQKVGNYITPATEGDDD